MPELPEVTTTVNGLRRTIVGDRILDVWTDLSKENPIKQFRDTIKDKKFFLKFKKEVKNKKVISAERRAKNILINLDNKKTILVHLKMTGHLLFGEYTKKIVRNGKLKITNWIPREDSPLKDPYNRFIHVVFTMSSGKHLALCDSRKFGKITLFDTDEAHKSKHLQGLGHEPLDKNFNFNKFKKLISEKPNKNIKTVLMDQSLVVGIGNIYSDEILWASNVHPESKPENIKDIQLKEIFKNMKILLKKGINLGGDSMSDYRNVYGEKGKFQNHHNVYRKTKEKCGKKGCNGVIMRKLIDGRSAHFCNKHQKIY